MIINDTIPPTASRREFKAFLFQVLGILFGWTFKILVDVLSNVLVSDGSFGFCVAIHVGVMFGVSMFAHFSAFLLTSPPPRRERFWSCDWRRVYLLHVSALLHAGTPLPVGFAWNAVKNDLLALLPLPWGDPSFKLRMVLLMLLVQLLLTLFLAQLK